MALQRIYWTLSFYAPNTIDYLPSNNPSGCHIRVHTVIYLFLDELWTVPSEYVLIASILDPCFKNIPMNTWRV